MQCCSQLIQPHSYLMSLLTISADLQQSREQGCTASDTHAPWLTAKDTGKGKAVRPNENPAGACVRLWAFFRTAR